MSVVAPISGVSAAVVPVVFGLLAGERPAAVAFVGLGLAFGAIALVGADGPDVHLPDLAPTPVADAQVADRSGPDGPGPPTPEPPIARGRAHWRQVVTAAAAGGGFGLFAVFIDRAGGDAGLWPLIWGRVATVCAFWVLSRIWHQRVRTDRPTRGLVGLTALLDASANALYLAAVNRGFLAIVGAIVALYPATTVLLARVVLHERLARNQRLGLVVAAAAVTLVAFG